MTNLLDYQQRVIDEYGELAHKLDKLRSFIGSDSFRKVTREEARRLAKQEIVMTEYADVLYERIQAFESQDFLLGKACDLSGESTCEACQ